MLISVLKTQPNILVIGELLSYIIELDGIKSKKSTYDFLIYGNTLEGFVLKYCAVRDKMTKQYVVLITEMRKLLKSLAVFVFFQRAYVFSIIYN